MCVILLYKHKQKVRTYKSMWVSLQNLRVKQTGDRFLCDTSIYAHNTWCVIVSDVWNLYKRN